MQQQSSKHSSRALSPKGRAAARPNVFTEAPPWMCVGVRVSHMNVAFFRLASFVAIGVSSHLARSSSISAVPLACTRLLLVL